MVWNLSLVRQVKSRYPALPVGRQGGGDLKPASKASVEGEAPSGFAGGGGDASPYK